MRVFVLVLTLVALALPGRAFVPPGPTDPDELEAFLDGLLPSLMESHHVPGAVFVMVKEGRVFFAKGWGHADLDSRRPVDPETTLFRVASVSKLFTATAAMQLVEQGKLDLHADVNTYLKEFQLEEAFDGPVTLHHLLTHTGGFDDRFLRSSRRVGSVLPSLGRYLAERMPLRVMPPGRILSYSNHGIALVGHLVEQASGMDFPQYVQTHVLEPLGMERSRFFLEVPLSPDLASSYQWKDGSQVALGHDHTLLGPAAELNTTGTDMARFMIAHLELGRSGEQRILGEETARLMQQRHFTHHPELDGWCYGFTESRLNGVRTIGHGGDWRGFRTSLVLVPEANMGFFVSVNGAFQGPFFRTLGKVFADHYYALPDAPPREPPEGALERATLYEGTYIPNRRIRSSVLKLGEFLGMVRVRVEDDGSLLLRFAGGDPLRLVESGPHQFRQVDGDADVAFLLDDGGRVQHLALGSWAFDRVSPLRSPLLHALLAGLCVLLFLGTLGGWVLGAGARALAGAGPSPISLPARLTGSVVCLLGALTMIGTAITLMNASLFDLLYESVPLRLRLLFLFPLASIPPTLAMPWLAWRGTSRSSPAPLAKAHYWLLTGAAFVILVLAYHWNLFGFGS